MQQSETIAKHGPFVMTHPHRVFRISGTREASTRTYVRIPEWIEKLDVIIPKATNILKFREERRDSSNREEAYVEADPVKQ